MTGSGNLGRRAFSGCSRSRRTRGRTVRPVGAARVGEGARQRGLAPGGAGERAADDRGEPVGRLLDLGPLVAPGLGDAVEDGREAGHAVAVVGREVGAAEERAAVGGQEHRHRPAAAAECLERGHVDLVDVGPLLAVDLDADELLVQQSGDLGVHEALALHDVAPVARRVADREEDRLVLGLGLGERLGTPGIPVDRVVGVEQQVGARLPGEPVGGRPRLWPGRRRGPAARAARSMPIARPARAGFQGRRRIAVSFALGCIASGDESGPVGPSMTP